ncbi:hypothetical protein [Blastococcus sp. SYSU D00820]
MSETPDERPRPTPRPRPASGPRPSPRPRVAGSRRDRDEAGGEPARTSPRPQPRPAPRSGTGRPAASAEEPVSLAKPAPARRPAARPAARRSRPAPARPAPPAARSRRVPVGAVLAALCVLAAAAVGYLLWKPVDRTFVTPDVFDAARTNVEALYAFDYRDADGSVAGQLDVLTGDLRDQYEAETQSSIIATYEQVSATTRYEVVDVGLQQVNDDQTAATLVVFGQLVVESVNSGTQPAPEGSECVVTEEGEQSCTQTVRIDMVQVDEAWKISDLTLLTTG